MLRVKLKVPLGSANVPSAKPIWEGSKVTVRLELSRVPTTLKRSRLKRFNSAILILKTKEDKVLYVNKRTSV
ncbi:unknown protein [Microcystis aeruginosa NIES-843]|uniref:Uncharacterized protein n=1 Tax=Microcystis aeruginosa (strain NIES-843 / IAM M-2473) TaxID=449447 RepID=B0JNZ7_MICAN|nr:unknown protein [Microcystis aeruginosa NIES-843]